VVRPAAVEDAGGIARVRVQTWRAAYSHVFAPEQLDTITEDRDAVRWGVFLSELPARTATFVATRGERVLGFASLGPVRTGDDVLLGELFTIYVHPDEWGLGIGRALMAKTLERLRAEGFVEAVLWVLEDNPRTHRFYERAGWRADGGVEDQEWLGATVRQVRFRIVLAGATGVTAAE
jgi:GNAT superfamily N-acetyltransferase